MAGKACVLAGGPLAYALDKLSKNTLIDLVADRARAEIGEEAADSQVAWLIQQWLEPVTVARKDRAVNLAVALLDYARVEASLAEQAERYRQASARLNEGDKS